MSTSPIAYQETSRMAWRSFLPVSAKLDRVIMLAIELAGPEGITCEAIEHVTNRKHASVSGNLRHLAEKGFVRNTGRRGTISTKRSAILWALAEYVEAPPVAPVEDRE